jgi:NAD(P)-dependent dehydrogenase (short-subunit alcohol dehydrogenase family)
LANEYLQSVFDLRGRVVLVIGGTGVLGGALSRGLARAGAKVIVAGRDETRGERCVAAIRGEGACAGFVAVDVSQRQSLESLCLAVQNRYGHVDGLINCFGVNSAVPYFEITDDDWDRVIDTNLCSTHWACQVFGRHMIESGQGGAIVNIGSVTCVRPASRVFAYSASKAALLSLTQSLAREWALTGVRVNLLCPGFFRAEQNRNILDEERVANITRHTPMARFGQPEELVGAALLLLSSKAGSFITGATVYVDGGFSSTTI